MPRDPLVLRLELECSAQTCFDSIDRIVRRADKDGWTEVVIKAGKWEPITLLAALAPRTRHIGLVAEIDPATTPPYTAARRLAALDHASNGRAGWHVRHCADVGRSTDFIGAVQALWDTWADDAHVIDQASGQYLDTTRVRAARYSGPFYTVAGPLDIPRPVQGHPVRYGGDPAADVPLHCAAVDAEAWSSAALEPVRHAGPEIAIRMPADEPLWSKVAARAAALLDPAPGDSGISRTLRQRRGLERPAAPATPAPARDGAFPHG